MLNESKVEQLPIPKFVVDRGTRNPEFTADFWQISQSRDPNPLKGKDLLRSSGFFMVSGIGLNRTHNSAFLSLLDLSLQPKFSEILQYHYCSETKKFQLEPVQVCSFKA